MDQFFSLFPNPERDFRLLALILVFPLLGALTNGLFGKRLTRKAVHTISVGAVTLSFLGSVVAFLMLATRVGHAGEGQHVRFVWDAWTWLSLDTTTLHVAFSLDTLSATMMLVITGVGGLIHLYSVGYMKGDPSYHRFFAYLNLFIFSMSILVLGDSLPILFVGWEGVGLCSYLLIGFWFEDTHNASAGKKAFIANRIGDFGLLVAMALLLQHIGALSWTGMEGGASALFAPVRIWPLGGGFPWAGAAFNSPITVDAATLVGLALLLGATGKSAQIPLFVWLPDAMAGPTPVSALIHAATMVTAGVYLVARMSFVFVLSPTAMMAVAGIGALTALFAATIGLVQRDIKKVLAYSTVSQLGYMFIGVGVGAFSAGIFHVLTHAFFKACLFLGAGSVIHAMHARVHDHDASQDMRNMGGLRKFMPFTFWSYLISTGAIIGFPLLSGFFSKDEILFRAYVNQIEPSGLLKNMAISKAMAAKGGALSAEAKQAIIDGLGVPAWFSTTVYVIGVLAAALTAFYMLRSVYMTFFGEFRGWTIVPGYKATSDHDHHEHAVVGADLDGPSPHESPWTMWVPLVVLATFAGLAGWLNAAPFKIHLFSHWINHSIAVALPRVTERAHGEHLEHLEHILLIPGVSAFLIGSGVAYWMYWMRKGEPGAVLAEKSGGLYRLILDKWRIDELYDATIIGFFDTLAEGAASFDQLVVDGLVAKIPTATVQGLGAVLRLFQNGKVQTYGAIMTVGMLAIGYFFAVPHVHPNTKLSEDGDSFIVQTNPGFGYRYRWDRDGDGKWDNNGAWTLMTKTKVPVEPGKAASLRLQVRSPFNLTTEQTIRLQRPKRDLSAPTYIHFGKAPKGGSKAEVN